MRFKGWSEEKIVSRLIVLAEQGNKLTEKEITQKDSMLKSAIYARDDLGQPLFFGSIITARKAAANALVEQGRLQLAAVLRRANKPRKPKRKWSRQRIIDELITLHENGVQLTAERIKGHSQLHGALYYCDRDGNNVYFSSINEAREIASQQLKERGDNKGAAEIKIHNHPKLKRKLERKQKLKKQETTLVQKLFEKIRAGENLAYRAQKQKNPGFIKDCSETFGSYRECFVMAGVNYTDYIGGPEKHSRSYYLRKLMDLILVEEDLSTETVNNNHESLADRLSDHYGGYFSALLIANKVLLATEETFSGIDVNYWRNRKQKERAEEHQENKQRKLTEIVTFDVNKKYPFFGRGNPSYTGKQVVEILKEYDAWLTPNEIGVKLGCTGSNILKNVLWRDLNLVVKYKNGDRHRYLLSKVVLDKYERTVESRVQPQSASQVAQNLGISYAQIRRVKKELDIIATKRPLTDEEIIDIKAYAKANLL